MPFYNPMHIGNNGSSEAVGGLTISMTLRSDLSFAKIMTVLKWKSIVHLGN